MTQLSIIVITKGIDSDMTNLFESLEGQDYKEIVLVNETNSRKKPDLPFKFKYATVPLGSGFSIARNKGLKTAKGSLVAFIDSDEVASPNWAKKIKKRFSNKKIDVVSGNTKIHHKNLLADSISALGFPGGANVGFDKMWHVDSKGFTDHLSTCNCAFRKKVFNKVKGFDNSLKSGAEDAELSYRLKTNGIKIKYCNDVLVFHKPRSTMNSFVKWNIKRGRANFHFKQQVKQVSNFISLRLWSSKNILDTYKFKKEIVLIFPLLFFSFVFQELGYYLEKSKHAKRG